MNIEEYAKVRFEAYELPYLAGFWLEPPPSLKSRQDRMPEMTLLPSALLFIGKSLMLWWTGTKSTGNAKPESEILRYKYHINGSRLFVREILEATEEKLTLGEEFEWGWALHQVDLFSLWIDNEPFFFQNALAEYIIEAGFPVDELRMYVEAANAEGEDIYPLLTDDVIEKLIAIRYREEEEGSR